jgi:hypothetical protein
MLPTPRRTRALVRLAIPSPEPSAAAGLDIGTIVQGFLTGGVSGGITALVIGLIKSKMAA